MGCHFLLQGIFPTQESNPCLLHCRWILYHCPPGKPLLLIIQEQTGLRIEQISGSGGCWKNRDNAPVSVNMIANSGSCPQRCSGSAEDRVLRRCPPLGIVSLGTSLPKQRPALQWVCLDPRAVSAMLNLTACCEVILSPSHSLRECTFPPYISSSLSNWPESSWKRGVKGFCASSVHPAQVLVMAGI